MVLIGRDRRGGHRVDGVGCDQSLHVEEVVVLGVFCRGGGPQRSLGAGSVSRQRAISRRGELVQEVAVGDPRVGDRGLAQERPGCLVPDGIEPVVCLGVEPGDEERGHRGHPGQIATDLVVVLEA